MTGLGHSKAFQLECESRLRRVLALLGVGGLVSPSCPFV